jgi:hypothetical protein
MEFLSLIGWTNETRQTYGSSAIRIAYLFIDSIIHLKVDTTEISRSGFVCENNSHERSGLIFARIVVRDIIEMRSTTLIFRACQSIERT